MKLLVKTKNLLLTTMMGEIMYPHRCSVVGNSAFLQGKIARGDVAVVEQLPDEAKDSDWEKFLLESKDDHDLALASFKSFLAGETEESQADAEAAEKAAAEAAAKAEEEAAEKAAAEAAAKAEEEAAEKAAAAKAAEAKAEAEAADAAAANKKKGS